MATCLFYYFIMTIKKNIAILVALSLIGICVFIALKSGSNDNPVTNYFNKQNPASVAEGNGKEATEFSEPGDSAFDINTSGKEILTKEGGIGKDTLELFKDIQYKFMEAADKDDHLNKVYRYLLNRYGKEQADALFKIYRNYIECEIMMLKEFQAKPIPTSAAEWKERLKQIQDFRRKFLGQDAADKLFASELKDQEYTIKRGELINDKGLYGAEKEARLEDLNNQTWGGSQASQDPYEKYQEKLSLYEKDISEAKNDKEREAIVHQLREKCFDAETIKRLEDTDKKTKYQQAKDNYYQEQRSLILNNKALDEKSKAEKINKLQNEVYGESQAANVKRMERMQQGYDKLKSEAERNNSKP